MVARRSGALDRHISADNNPIHNMHGVRPITAEPSPSARPAELHNVKPVQF